MWIRNGIYAALAGELMVGHPAVAPSASGRAEGQERQQNPWAHRAWGCAACCRWAGGGGFAWWHRTAAAPHPANEERLTGIKNQ